VVDDLFDGIEPLLDSEGVFVVNSSKVIGGDSSSEEIGGTFETN